MLCLIPCFCTECAFGCLCNLASLTWSMECVFFSYWEVTFSLQCSLPMIGKSDILQSSGFCLFVWGRREEKEVQTGSPDLLNDKQLCSHKALTSNETPGAYLLQIMIQFCSSLLYQIRRTEKFLLSASSSAVLFFIFLVWMAGGVIRGPLGHCFITTHTQRTS